MRVTNDMSRGNYTTRITEAFLRGVTPSRVVGLMRLLVYDFDTGSSALLSQHVEGLSRHVLPYLGPSAPPISVWIGGLASRRGDVGINIRLARARATMVERFLFSRAPDAGLRHGVTATSFGEELSQQQSENFGHYRSALVLVNGRRPIPTPNPRPPINLRESLFNRFRIAQLVSADAGEIIVGGGGDFVIDYDVAQSNSPPSDPIIYELSGAGFGGGLPAGGTLSDPGHPEWNAFLSPVVTTTRGFQGQGRLANAGVSIGPYGIGHTTLRLIPDSWDEDVFIDNFQTDGQGLSAGASIIQGRFTRSSRSR